MKAIHHFTLLIILLFPALTTDGGNDSLVVKLNRHLDQWHFNAAKANHEAYIGAMTTDGVFIGTDATEYWTTKEFSKWCKPYFDRGKSWNFKALSRNIYINRDSTVAWFDELLKTQMGICRGSGTMLIERDAWKIAQYVLSATIPNSTMNLVTAMKAGTDSMLILRNIFEKHHVQGTMIIYDPETGKYSGYNEAKWDSGYLPASTFKIANTLIGLETGVIDSGYVFKWDGDKRRMQLWEEDLPLKEAFRVSCVPCYQELARKIGIERMKTSLKAIEYPGMDVTQENIDLFWLEGKSRITPRQQVDFIRRFYEGKLPLKASVVQTVKSIMINEVTADYTLSCKTGWAIRNGNNYGWFVGFVETKGKVFYFATLVEPENQQVIEDFIPARKLVTMEVLRETGFIN